MLLSNDKRAKINFSIWETKKNGANNLTFMDLKAVIDIEFTSGSQVFP